jgi:hypothetical protein
MHSYLHAHTHKHTYIQDTYTPIPTIKYIIIQTHRYTYIHTNTHRYTHIQTYPYTYTNKHTHIPFLHTYTHTGCVPQAETRIPRRHGAYSDQVLQIGGRKYKAHFKDGKSDLSDVAKATASHR